MQPTRKPRIRIEDLPPLEHLSEEEAARLVGAGRFRPGFETLEDRQLLSASPAELGAVALDTYHRDNGDLVRTACDLYHRIGGDMVGTAGGLANIGIDPVAITSVLYHGV